MNVGAENVSPGVSRSEGRGGGAVPGAGDGIVDALALHFADNLNEGVVVVDTELRYRFINRFQEAWHGVPNSELIGRHIAEAWPVLNGTCVVDSWLRALAGETVFTPDVHLPAHRNGEDVWTSGRIAPLRDAAGEIVGAVGTIRDITERKRMERLLAAENELLQAVVVEMSLDRALEAICVFMERQAPGTLASILLLDGGRLLHGAAPSFPPEYAALVSGIEIGPGVGSCGSAAFYARTVMSEDIMADPLWANYRGFAAKFGLRACFSAPVLAQNGAVLGTLAAYYREARTPDDWHLRVTGVATHIAAMVLQRARAELVLAESEAEKSRHVALLEASLDSMGEAVVISDLDGRLYYWNRAALDLFGYQSLDECRRLLPEFQDTFEIYDQAGERLPVERWPLTRVLRGESLDRQEMAVRHKGAGWTRTMVYSGRLARDAKGEPLLGLLTISDMTEQRSLEEQLRQAQKLEAVGHLAGGVAHDFNNLLTVIVGNIELLRDSGGIPVAGQEAFAEIMASCERAAKLTRQLLTFSQRRKLNMQLLDLNVIVSDMLKLLRRVLGEHVSLRFDVPGTPQTVRADAGMIEQVVMNLAINARDAMPGGGRLEIETGSYTTGAEEAERLSVAAGSRYAWFAVADTGCGMPPEVRARIFEPFFTTKEAGRGSGLGLATVYGIVKQHGGWLDVKSEAGCGTIVTVYLPAAQAPAEARSAREERPRMPRGTETILLVEDEDFVRRVAVALLTRLGYSVIEAESGTDALRLWEEAGGRVDLLLTDLMMPGGVNGRELAERLRARQPRLRVVYFSGYSERVMSGAGVLREGVNFIPKPFETRLLAETIRAALDAPQHAR